MNPKGGEGYIRLRRSEVMSLDEELENYCTPIDINREIGPPVVSSEVLDKDLFRLALDGRAKRMVQRGDIKGILDKHDATSLPYDVFHTKIDGDLWAMDTTIGIWKDQSFLQVYIATPDYWAKEYTEAPEDFETCEFIHATNFAMEWIGTNKLRAQRKYDPIAGTTALTFTDLEDRYEVFITTNLR